MRLLSRLGLLNGSGWGSGGTLDIHMSFRWLCFGLSGGLKKRWCRRYGLDLVAWAEIRVHSGCKTDTVESCFQPFTIPTSQRLHTTAFTVNTPGNSPTAPFLPPLLSPMYSSPPIHPSFPSPHQTGVCNRPVPRTDSREALRGTRLLRAICYSVVGKLTSYRMA